ncbi:MAG: SDR family NAD(P)-dependent oxidoreductase [Candidatus Weimeria sp.]
MHIVNEVYSRIVSISGNIFFWMGLLGIVIAIIETIRLRHYRRAAEKSSSKKIAVITGASNGLGRGYVRALKDKMSEFDIDEFWLVARSGDRLRALADEIKVPAKVLPADLTKEASFDMIKKQLESGDYQVSLLINCAGFGLSGTSEQIGNSGEQQMISLNDSATVAMIHTCLPFMKAGSRIVNIASVAAFQSLKGFNAYSASKAFVLSYSRALRQELVPEKITVTAICPYWIRDTGFIETASGHRSSPFLSAKTETIVRRSLRTIYRRGMVSTPSIVSFLDFVIGQLLPDNVLSRISSMLRV